MHLWKADCLRCLSQTHCEYCEVAELTHQALLLTLPRSPRRFLTRTLTTSPTKFLPIDRNAGFSSWSERVKLTESFHFRQPDRSLPGYLVPEAGTGVQTMVLCVRGISCCRNVKPKQLTVESFWEEDLRPFFVSNQLSSASHLERNISLIRTAVSGPVCFHD